MNYSQRDYAHAAGALNCLDRWLALSLKPQEIEQTLLDEVVRNVEKFGQPIVPLLKPELQRIYQRYLEAQKSC